MSKTAITASYDAALAAAFTYHLENTSPPITPAKARYSDAQGKFIDSLTDEQQAAYRQLDAELSSVETEEYMFYYRLGLMDGLAAWRGVNV